MPAEVTGAGHGAQSLRAVTRIGAYVMSRRRFAAGLIPLAAAGAISHAAASSRLAAKSGTRAETTDTALLRAALAAWQRRATGLLKLERGKVYDLGVIDDIVDLFPITNIAEGVLDGNGATIVATSAPGLAWNLFSFSDVRNLRIVNLAFVDRGYRDEAWGMKALVFQPGSSGTSHIEIDGIVGRRLFSMVQAQGPYEGAPRVEGISLSGECRAERCYNALCCQDQGDRITGRLETLDCRRSYIAYGVSGHRLQISIRHTGARDIPPTRAPVLLKSYRRATVDHELALRFSGPLTFHGLRRTEPGACVMVEDQSSGRNGVVFSGIRLDIDTVGSLPDGAPPYLVAFSQVNSQGKTGSRASSSWQDVMITARLARKLSIAGSLGFESMKGLVLRGDAAGATRVVIHANI